MGNPIKITVEGEDRASSVFGTITGSLGGIGEAAGSAGGHVSGFFSNMLSTAGGVLAAGVFSRIGEGISSIAGAMIGGNAEFERYQAQFATLMGNSDQAKAHLDDLSKFASTTPFELPDVVQASKALLTFGGTALDTAENMNIVGNAAAASGAPIQEVATWYGRASMALQNGKPFGEAAQRLMELGILSGPAREKIEALQKSGASGATVWAEFQKSLTAPADAMEKLGKTSDGLKSTFEDNLSQIGRTIGAPFFEIYKAGLGKAIDLMSSPAVQASITGLAESIRDGMSVAVSAVSGFIDIFKTGFEGDGMLGGVSNLLYSLDGISPIFDTIGDALPNLVGQFTRGFGVIKDIIGGAFKDGFSLQGVFQALMGLREALINGITQLLPQWIAALEPLAHAAIEWVSKAVPGLLAALGAYARSMISFLVGVLPQWGAQLLQFGIKLVSWIGDQLPALGNNLGQFLNGMIKWVVDSLPAWIENLKALGAQAIQWILDALPGLATNLGQFAGNLLGWIAQTVIDVGPKLIVLAGKFLAWVVTDVIPALPGVLATIAGALWTFITETAKTAGPKLGELAGKFYNWVKDDVIPQIPTELGKLWGAISDWITGILSTASEKASELGAAIASGISGAVKDGLDTLWGIVKSIINPVIDGINTVIEGINAVADIAGEHVNPIPRLALGTNFWPGGLAVVGEAGPELARFPGGGAAILSAGIYNLPTGTQVESNQRTREAFSSDGASFGSVRSGPASFQEIHHHHNEFRIDARGSTMNERQFRQIVVEIVNRYDHARRTGASSGQWISSSMWSGNTYVAPRIGPGMD